MAEKHSFVLSVPGSQCLPTDADRMGNKSPVVRRGKRGGHREKALTREALDCMRDQVNVESVHPFTHSGDPWRKNHAGHTHILSARTRHDLHSGISLSM